MTNSAPALGAGSLMEAADIYRVYFHGPAYQVLKRAWWEADTCTSVRCPTPCRTIAGRARSRSRLSPRLIELCFQTAGLLEMSTQHSMGLPRHVDRVTFPQARRQTDRCMRLSSTILHGKASMPK